MHEHVFAPTVCKHPFSHLKCEGIGVRTGSNFHRDSHSTGGDGR